MEIGLNDGSVIEVDVKEVLKSMSRRDKDELVVEYLRQIPPYDVRKILCDAFYVSSYMADDALRAALEPIISAR